MKKLVAYLNWRILHGFLLNSFFSFLFLLFLFELIFFFTTQVVVDMVVIGAMAEVTDPIVVEIEAMVEEREAMVEVTDPTAVVVVVVVDTPTGAVDTPVAVAVDTGIIGEGFLKHRIILYTEQFYDHCNREHFKYGKYYFWF